MESATGKPNVIRTSMNFENSIAKFSQSICSLDPEELVLSGQII
jgi:hypothetical protein